MKINRLTWAGFGIALLAWTMLIADMVVSDAALKAGNLVAVLSLRGDILTIAQTMILSGFGLAIVGTLRSGFGAFTRFFDAVLQRSGAPPRSRESTTLEPEPLETEPEHTPTPTSNRAAHTITITPKVVTPERSKPSGSRDKNYVILSDGSVEVETMFGTRVFANLSEAKDFIR